jgi:transposase
MAISLDLRRRVLDAYERGEGSVGDVAARFSIGSASLSRWIKRKRTTGSPARAPRSGGSPRRITAEGETLLKAWLSENPSVAQHELAARLHEATGQLVLQQTVSRALSPMRLTRKKNDAPEPTDHA